jgi:hypothetical protein
MVEEEIKGEFNDEETDDFSESVSNGSGYESRD